MWYKDIESTINHDKITIHPNSNFDHITYTNITTINEESKINIALSKPPFSTNLQKNVNVSLKSTKI